MRDNPASITDGPEMVSTWFETKATQAEDV